MTIIHAKRRNGRCRSLWLGAAIALVAGACVDRGEPLSMRETVAAMRLMRDVSRLEAQVAAAPDFWARSATQPLTPDERAWLFPLFASFIDHDLAMVAWRDRLVGRGDGRDVHAQALRRAMGLGVEATLIRTRLALWERVGDNDAIRAALDDGSPEHGIAAGHLSRLLIETARPDTPARLDIAYDAIADARDRLGAPAAEPQDLNAVWQALRKEQIARREGEDVAPAIQAQLAKLSADGLAALVADRALEKAREARKTWNQQGSRLVKRVIGEMITNEVKGVLHPIVADIALWMGDSRLRSEGRRLIRDDQLDEVLPDLEPGDIVVERRNWYLSNLGLPGFWPHAALFVGSPAELAAWADDDGVRALFPQGLVEHLKATRPQAWAAYSAAHADGPARVLESVSEGVVFTTLHHSCGADHVAFLRPRRSRAVRAYAIAQAFSHFEKPYDFDFDFQTLSVLVCSELVFQAYQLPSAVGESLDLSPLPSVMGRVTLPPNDMIARFDAEFETPAQQLDFVAFLDGDEASGAAVRADAAALRASWRRPKWDLNQ